MLTEIPTQKVKAGTLTRRLNACGLSLDTSHLGVARADLLALTDWARRFELLARQLLLVPRGQEVLVLLSNEKAGAVQPVLGAPLGLSNAVQGCPARSTPCGGPWHTRTCDRQICPDRRSPALATPPVAAHDQQSNARLLQTLRVFLEQNRSWQAAAGTLHIHKTSLTYRIRRIEELTGRRSATPLMWPRCGWPCRRRISSGTRGRTTHHPSDDRETVYRLLWSRSPRCLHHSGMRATTLISKSKPASQLTPTAVQFG